MNSPYDKKVETVASKKEPRPQAAFKYRERVGALIKFAVIFFAVMVVGTIVVSLLLMAK